MKWESLGQFQGVGEVSQTAIWKGLYSECQLKVLLSNLQVVVPQFVDQMNRWIDGWFN